MGIMDEWADDEALRNILSNSKNIAVVGISDKPGRPSNMIGRFLLEMGYRVFPVNPVISEWKGIPVYPSLLQIEEEIDIVDVFKRAEEVMSIAIEAIKIGAKVFWMQSGIVNRDAARLLSNNGIFVVMDRCIMVEIGRLIINRWKC